MRAEQSRRTEATAWRRRAHELDRLMDDLQRTARTARAATRAERAEACTSIVTRLRDELEPHARLDSPGLQAIAVWLEALAHADPGDPDLVQELLYGVDALVRVHVSRETGRRLEPPQPLAALLR
jgi:hypothetical protein